MILTFVSYYLPGYKSGGPLRTIFNMVEHLSEDFDFWIVTRDRDLGDQAPYVGVVRDEWQVLNGVHVYYVSPERAGIYGLSEIVKSTRHDVLYLNSYFDPVFTSKVLLGRRLLSSTDKPVVLAPRGEFSISSLQLKWFKKRAYLALAGFLGLYNEVTFQASSEYEELDIINALGVPTSRVKIAIDLPERSLVDVFSPAVNLDKAGGVLKVIFISRLSPKKNLDYALQVLAFVGQRVQFDIYGPKEDVAYWASCERLIAGLPKNVNCNYCGSVEPSEVKRVFSGYDLFFFPTRGENYGHVIAESISVGTPVLLSDQTPWRNLEVDGLGWDLPLGEPSIFAEKIDAFSKLPPTLRHEQRDIVKAKAIERLLDPMAVKANRELFFSQI